MSKIIKKEIPTLKTHGETLDFAHIFITRKCNLHCRHCYTNSDNSINDILPFSFWEDAIKQLYALKVRRIHVEGGEAFLHPDFDKIIKLLTALKFKEILVVTNGILATRERLETLKKYGLKKIAVSLDSLIENVHNDLRPGSYESALQAVKYAVELGFHTRISCCLNKKNIKHLRSFVDEVFTMGVRTLNLDWFVGVGRGNALFDEYGITENDFELLSQFEADIHDIILNAKYQKVNLCIDLPDWYTKRDTFMIRDVSRTRFLDCDAVSNQVSINEVGNVYPCFIFAYGDKLLGNLKNNSLLEIIRNSKFSCSDCPIKAKGHVFYKYMF
jgi:MoaA/NifB/PqqE/SkfB family radical SAM enzyme